MKKKNLFISIFLSVIISGTLAQNTYSRFYYQRVSLFEILPVTEEDIIFLGNSITNGAEWSELFNDIHVKNRGISGDTAEGVYDRLDVITKGNPKKIFLMIGINDLIKGNTPESIAITIDNIIKKLKESCPNTKIYLQSLLPANRIFSDAVNQQGAIRGLNNRLVEITQKYNIDYIDLHRYFKNTNDDGLNLKYSNDGLHLMSEGYLLWKSLIMSYIAAC